VNYKNRIETLQHKGIITEEHAASLKETVDSSPPSLAKPKQSYRLVWGGVVMLMLLLFCGVTLSMSSSIEHVEDVSIMLNAPNSSGIQAWSLVIWILLLGVLAGYLLLSLLAYHRHAAFWALYREIIYLRAAVSAAELITQELLAHLERLLGEDYLHQLQLEEKQRESLIVNHHHSYNEATLFVMETYRESLEEHQADQKHLSILEEECRQRSVSFPDTLARLAGALPPCTGGER
jgi:hypothetical protein